MTEAAWGASGLAWLTGDPGGRPDFSRAAVLQAAAQVAQRFTGATGAPADAATLLAGRAGLLGWTRAGRISAGGASRLLTAADGWWALTLSRPDDLDAVPALIESDCAEPWAVVTAWAADKPAAEVVARARLLDLPAAALGETASAPPTIRRVGPSGPGRGVRGALVVDLTSLWAGPLCGQLLAQAGATVVKVESPSRPDGTRGGPREFFDWMNGGKLSCALDFDRDAAVLSQLLGAADVVLEGSRPAALARRELGPFDIAGRPGRVWLQITAHGADGGFAGFGDDAAVAGGLVGCAAGGGPVFCGDAIADPLTGIEAAAAVVDALARGGGEVITFSLAAVAAGYAALPLHVPAGEAPVLPPPRPRIEATGPELGADNALVRELVAKAGSRC
ncbi:CoA transferase [Mycolicibacter longobardus]|uniref:Acyl-CoA transferase n=1 Tax=Mycolicibacter longobardus TaxID=1108812 RepID=A0A1X1YHW7_9MYCO|nr:CoA transferase [Mycolicibacter longobardus]MCV7385846.1 CoA transferase [Mycolicibacter longobardus]ORW10706.1 acyl-CoA transferase [Mycolicibacter longobardus]